GSPAGTGEPTAAPPRAPTGPKFSLSGSISGPSSVKPNSTCMWETAGGSGGTAPYDYSWLSSQGDWGYGMTFYATAPSSGPMVITLTITDANLDEVTVRKTVGVSPSAPVCIPSGATVHKQRRPADLS